MTTFIDDESRFGGFVARVEDECRRRGEMTLAEINDRAQREGFRGSAVIEELSITEGFEIDYTKGAIICR